MDLGIGCFIAFICVSRYFIDSCLLYRFASLCGCRSIFILFEVLKLYTCIYIILWICYCGVQLPVCTLAYVKQNICFKTVNLNDSSTGWIFSFKLQHNQLHKISTIKNCLSLLSEFDVIRVIFCLYTTSLFMILSPY